MSNNPRMIWSPQRLKNPSFEGEGSNGVLPLNWNKLGDADDGSTLEKEIGARESELGFSHAESILGGTDTEADNFQDISIPIADFSIADTFLFACWLKTTAAMDFRIRIETRTAAEAIIESNEVVKSSTNYANYTYLEVELDLTTLASYDHFRIIIRNETTGQTLSIDDCVFGIILDFPILTADPGTGNIRNLNQLQEGAIDNFSLSNVPESLRAGAPYWVFDLEILNFRQDFYDKLFRAFKVLRNGGNNWFSFYLDKDLYDMSEFHYPYINLTTTEFSRSN